MNSELEAKGKKRTRTRKEKERKQEICNEGKENEAGRRRRECRHRKP